MAAVNDTSGSEETKRTGESFASMASTGSTLRSASPADLSKTPKVRFDSLPLPPPSQAKPTPKKATLAQIFNFDKSTSRAARKFEFNFESPPEDKSETSSVSSAGGEAEAELKVFTGDEGRVGAGQGREGSASKQSQASSQSDEGDELMSSAASDDGSTGPSSPPVVSEATTTTKATKKAGTPQRLNVSVASRGVTPTMATNMNMKPPPLPGKSLKIDHQVEVRTPSKVKVTLQPPESADPASIDPPSSDVHQPTAKLAACKPKKFTIAEIKKGYLSYAQQVKNEKSKVKLQSLPRRASLKKKRAGEEKFLKEKRSPTGAQSKHKAKTIGSPIISELSDASTTVIGPTLADVIEFIEAHPAIVAPPVTFDTDLSLVARLTPVLITEVRDKLDTFRRLVRDADVAGAPLRPYMEQWKRWVDEHNAFVMHDKLRRPAAL